jgi:hypothetical protein
MSQDPDKYLYFHVGLLKNSFALDALRQDALKYHMIDQPDQLIALRLTEYYELIAGGVLPRIGVPLAVGAAASSKRDGREETPTNPTASDGASPTTGQEGVYHSDEENIVTASPHAEQNADEAAEYWAQLQVGGQSSF